MPEAIDQFTAENLKHVRQILNSMIPLNRDQLGPRSLFDQASYRDVLFDNYLPFAFLELVKCAESGYAQINVGFDLSKRGTKYRYISIQAIQELMNHCKQNNPNYKAFVISISLDNMIFVNMFRQLKYNILTDDEFARRNKVSLKNNRIMFYGY